MRIAVLAFDKHHILPVETVAGFIHKARAENFLSILYEN